MSNVTRSRWRRRVHGLPTIAPVGQSSRCRRPSSAAAAGSAGLVNPGSLQGKEAQPAPGRAGDGPCDRGEAGICGSLPVSAASTSSRSSDAKKARSSGVARLRHFARSTCAAQAGQRANQGYNDHHRRRPLNYQPISTLFAVAKSILGRESAAAGAVALLLLFPSALFLWMFYVEALFHHALAGALLAARAWPWPSAPSLGWALQ